MLLYSIIIITIFIFTIYKIFKYNYGHLNPYIIKGYGKNTENIKILLDRIEYSNHYFGRYNINVRYGFYSIIIAFLMNIIHCEKYNSLYMLQSILIIWSILICMNGFFIHHSDKFASYYIDNNINIIRSKLNLKSDIKKLKSYKNFKDDNCINFVYNQ